MELSSFGSIILRGNRIVIPQVLTRQVLELAHEGHPGETVMKRRLRAKVWWPAMDKQVEQFVKSCRDCLLVPQPNKRPPMTRHKFPEGPWECLAMDLMGPLPNKQMILVVIDYYSRYQEIKFLTSTTSSVIIKHLSDIFSRLGFPKSIRADNGPQFVSNEFKEFCKDHNIELIQTPPYWPQANGEVENMNKSILKRLQIAHANGRNYHTEIYKFLLMYNVTPHGTNGKSPSELLFGRNIRDKIPSISDLVLINEDEEAKDNDIIQKQKGKEREDIARSSKISDICTGDKVITQNMIIPHKLCSRFGNEEYKVIERKGNEVTIMKDGKTYKRHVSHVKKIIDSNPTVCKEQIVPLTLNSKSSEVENKMQEIEESQEDGKENYSATPSKEKGTTHINDPSTPLTPKVTPLKLKKGRECGDL